MPRPVRVLSIQVLLVLVLALTLMRGGMAAPPAQAPQPQNAEESAPLLFVENVGQYDARVRFALPGAAGTLWLMDDGLWATVLEPPRPVPPAAGPSRLSVADSQEAGPRRGVHIKLGLTGANPKARLVGMTRLDTHVSFFMGNNPAAWRSDVPVWSGVRYEEIYPGVDLEVTGDGGQWSWRLVARGALPGDLALSVAGADALELMGAGGGTQGAAPTYSHLRLRTAVGELAVPLLVTARADGTPLDPPGAPVAEGSNVRQPYCKVPGRLPCLPREDGCCRLFYASFLGGSGDDAGFAVAVDAQNQVYMAGTTFSTDFPVTPGAFDTTYRGAGDAFVAKFSPGGERLLYATFLGGQALDGGIATTFETDLVIRFGGLTVDSVGNAYVTAETFSADFPTTPGAFDTTYNGGGDAFVTKLNPTGCGLIYSTFLGGAGLDNGNAVVVDGMGNAYVTGRAISSDFPTTPGAYSRVNKPIGDVFVTKLSPDGSALGYSTFIGGSSTDAGIGLAVDPSGSAYVAGFTFSPDYPTTPGAFSRTFAGVEDAFVTRLNAQGSDLIYSTYLGGNETDGALGLALDKAGNAYVSGTTYSTNWPVTHGAFDETLNGKSDAFLTKLDPAGARLIYSTFLGGSDFDIGANVALSEDCYATTTGQTFSADYPTSANAFARTYHGNRDGFVSTLNATGSSLLCSTYLGGSDRDAAVNVAIDMLGNAVVTGGTRSADFPTTERAFSNRLSGGEDALLVRLGLHCAEPVGPGETPTPTCTARPSETGTAGPTGTAAPTQTGNPTLTSAPKPSETCSPTQTGGPTQTGTAKPTGTCTATQTKSPTQTGTAKPTGTAEPTCTRTPDATTTAGPSAVPKMTP